MKFKYYYQRDVTVSSSDDNYKKQTNKWMMIVSANVKYVELKKIVDLYSSHDFHKNFNTFSNTTAGLNPSVSVHLSTAITYSTTLQ